MEDFNFENIDRIVFLIKKSREHALSNEEINELEQWKNATISNADLYQRLSDDNYIGDKLLDMQSFSIDDHIENIHHKIKTPIIRMKRMNWVVAASVLLVLGIGAAFLLRNNFTNKANIQSAKTHFKNNIPSIQNVVLTLPNGQYVELRDFKDGDTITHGDVRIVNNKGNIVYLNKNNDAAIGGDNIVTTPSCKQFVLQLPDQTKVWLNASSSIKYPTVFSGKIRSVEITGEAYFEVTKNKKLPFVVIANEQKIEVLGTHFNINSYAQQASIKTTLLEGSVKVSSLKNQQNSVTLVPGQQSQLRAGNSLQVVNNVDVNEILSWKNGMFMFNNAALTDIMQVIASWYDVKVLYKSKINDRYTFQVPNSISLEQLLSYLEKSSGVHFEIDNQTITISQ